MKRLLILLLAVSAASLARPAVQDPSPSVPVVTTERDSTHAELLLAHLKKSRDTDVGKTILWAAMMFNGTPYVASTLERGEKEALRIYLTETDCILFVETCLNLVEAVRIYGKQADFDRFADLVRLSRYRDGRVERYSDRIHYTTEWIRRGEERGLLRDLSLELGGVAEDRPICYMSTHKDAYRQLAGAPGDSVAARDLAVIAGVEKKLSEVPQTWIPTAKIPQMEHEIRSGDIICFMSGVPGLDIAHVGIAAVRPGHVGFIHASSAGHRVMLEPRSIAEYAASRRNCPGIKVVRVQ